MKSVNILSYLTVRQETANVVFKQILNTYMVQIKFDRDWTSYEANMSTKSIF